MSISLLQSINLLTYVAGKSTELHLCIFLKRWLKHHASHHLHCLTRAWCYCLRAVERNRKLTYLTALFSAILSPYLMLIWSKFTGCFTTHALLKSRLTWANLCWLSASPGTARACLASWISIAEPSMTSLAESSMAWAATGSVVDAATPRAAWAKVFKAWAVSLAATPTGTFHQGFY